MNRDLCVCVAFGIALAAIVLDPIVGIILLAATVILAVTAVP